MIFSSAESRVPDSEGFASFTGNRFDIQWKGFAYVPGCRQGRESISRLEEMMDRDGIESTVANLKGLYCCLVSDRQTGTHYAFVDGGGLSTAYRTPRAVSNSFLELIANGAAPFGALRIPSMIEQIELGGCFFQRTLMSDIEKIARDEIVVFRPGSDMVAITRKSGLDLTSKPENKRFEYFENLAKALEDRKVHVDLTGGVDSRYTAAMLQHFGLKFSVGLSGHPSHPDIVVSRQVAKILGVPHLLVEHEWNDLEQGIRDCFETLDGLGDPATQYRPMSYANKLKSESVDVDIVSIGETYKDWIWYQDFPFYGSIKPNFQRLFDFRINSTKTPDAFWHPQMLPHLREWRKMFVRELEAFRYDKNTTSYDAMIAFGKGQASISQQLSGRARFTDVSVPFFDIDLIREATQMNPWSRVFDRVYRKDLTKINRAVAAAKTSEGLTVSAEPKLFAVDMVRLSKFYAKKGLKVVGRKLFRKSFFHPAAESPGFKQAVLDSRLFKDSVERLKELKVIADNAPASHVANRAGNLIALSLFFERAGDIPWNEQHGERSPTAM